MTLLDVIEEVRQEIAVAGSGVSEADAKAAFITPILAELGWRGLTRIRSEYSVDQGRMRFDYALLGSAGKPVALIEAKAPKEGLDTHVAQVMNSAFHEGVDICVLTTGVKWWLYLPREKGNPEDRRFVELEIDQDHTEATAEILSSCLRHEALIGGEGERLAKRMLASRQMEIRHRKEIRAAWSRLLSGPNDILIELLQEEVQDALGVRPSESLTRSELQEIATGQTSIADVSQSTQPASSQTDASRRQTTTTGTVRVAKRAATNVREIHLWGEVHPIGPAYEVLTTVAEMVYARHQSDFHRVLQLAKYHTTPSECRAPHRVGDSEIYLERHAGYRDSRRSARQLLEFFGYEAHELNIVLNE